MIHKKSLNGKYTKKRTQKDYSLSLKLQVVKEVELGYLTKSQTIYKVGRDKLFTILRADNMLTKPKKQYHITTNYFHQKKT